MCLKCQDVPLHAVGFCSIHTSMLFWLFLTRAANCPVLITRWCFTDLKSQSQPPHKCYTWSTTAPEFHWNKFCFWMVLCCQLVQHKCGWNMDKLDSRSMLQQGTRQRRRGFSWSVASQQCARPKKIEACWCEPYVVAVQCPLCAKWFLFYCDAVLRPRWGKTSKISRKKT